MRSKLRGLIGALVLALGMLLVPARPALAAEYEPRCDFSGSFRRTLVGVPVWLVPADSTIGKGKMCKLGKAKLVMQTDGNLVVYDENSRARWAVSWFRPDTWFRGERATFQDDHNFVVYGRGSTAIWASNTFLGHCCGWLAVQGDGNVVVYTETFTPLWATNTAH
jgi:hypothetical protein